jgi:hypothetical protein
MKADVTDEADIRRLVDEVIRTAGHIDARITTRDYELYVQRGCSRFESPNRTICEPSDSYYREPQYSLTIPYVTYQRHSAQI